jgi:hypothetical protein
MFDGVCHTSSPTNDCRTAFEPSLHISVRCQLCGYRFKTLIRGVRYVRIDEDARDYERLPTDFPFTLVHNEITVVKGRVSEISMSGCTLQTDMPMQLGQVIDLKLYISNDPIMIDSLVIRTPVQIALGWNSCALANPKEHDFSFSFAKNGVATI